MVIWIIDEEWNAYDVEISLLTKAFPGVMFRRSCYDFWHDLEEFGSTVDGLLAQVNVPLGDESLARCPALKPFPSMERAMKPWTLTPPKSEVLACAM